MKTTLLLLFLMAFASAMAQQKTKTPASHVSVEGTAGMLKDGTIIKFNIVGTNQTFDVPVKNGQFCQTFDGIDGERCSMTLNEKVKELFLTPGVVKVNIPGTSIKEAIVTGNIPAMEYDQLHAKLFADKTRTDWVTYSKVSPLGSSPEINQMHEAFKKAYSRRSNEMTFAHVEKNPNSAINTYLLYYAFLSSESTEAEIKNYLALVPKSSLTGVYGKKVKFLVDSLFVGGSAPDFVQNDVEGKPMNLKSFRGKYVLVDFWASWCAPCRAENPNVVKAYEKFKGKNFEIVAVSLDDKKDAWLAAIQKDGLPWIHVSDLGGWSNKVSRKYLVRSVPNNFLIDPDGKIVAKELRGDALSDKLSELFEADKR
jgi:thiol-disulfide isomerase/thioredoxin